MKLNHLLTIILFLSTANLCKATIIPSEDIFSSPEFDMARLSPSGKHLSIKERSKSETNLVITDLTTSEARVTTAFDKGVHLQDYTWLNDSQIHMEVKTGNIEVDYILVLDFEKNTEKSHKIEYGHIASALPNDPERVLFVSTQRRKDFPIGLYKISIDSLIKADFSNAELIDKTTKKIVDYYYDSRLNRLLTTQLDADEKEIVLKWRSLTSKKWKTLFRYATEDYVLSPVGFVNENILAVLSNKETDKVALHEFDIANQSIGKIIFQHQKYDLKSAHFDSDGQLESVHYYQNGIYTKQHFDKDSKRFATRLARSFGDKLAYKIDESLDGNVNLIYVVAAHSPPAYYTYIKSEKVINKLYDAFPKLANSNFSSTKPIAVSSTDGVKLEAFLTLPKENDHSTLLVMPHGGPIGVQETDNFNANVQFLANRGFSILRVNFRGSSGYGKAFLEQGVGQFGQLIEQDITASLNAVLDTHQFDNICSIGASYGGYSAMMLALKHPNTYKCVVAAYGIYDLPLLFNASNLRSGKEYHDYIAKVVGELDDLKEYMSPVYIAEKINVPVLIIAGEDDQIAGIEQSNRLKFILEENQKKVETIFYDNTRHGHSTWWGERHEAASTVDFLYRTLGLSYPNKKKLSDSEKSTLASDFALLADSYSFEYLVNRDAEKAFKFYTQAANYDHTRSLFNIGAHFHRGEFVEKNITTAVENYKKSAEQNFDGANRRLGRMYMEGNNVNQDFALAHEYLLKALELDDSHINTLRLGRFYCVASAKFKDIEKCKTHFTLKGLDEITHKQKQEVYDARRTELARAFVDGVYDQSQLEILRKFMMETYGLNHIDFDLDVDESGVFEFKETDKFGTAGTYELISKDNIIKGDENSMIKYGLRFNIDFDGFDSKKDKTVVFAKWSKINQQGEISTDSSLFLWGSSTEDWSTFRHFSVKDNSTFRLELFDLNHKIFYSRDFLSLTEDTLAP